jgi:hypothetical protein
VSAKEFVPPSPEAIRRVRQAAERELTADEVDDLLHGPWAAGEREEALALIKWFRDRYPTPSARLRWARQAYARWVKHQPPGAE